MRDSRPRHLRSRPEGGRAERTLVSTESQFTANEIEYRKLEQLQSKLDSFNLQATLIVGFSFTTMNADNLVALADDMSKFCVYKQPVLAHLYVIFTVVAIGVCMSCVMISMYIVWKSQQTANDVSVSKTIAVVRILKAQVMFTYFIGMASFFFAFLVLIWMYFGQWNWVPRKNEDRSFGQMPTSPNSSCPATAANGLTGNPSCDSYAANGWDTAVVTTSAGQTLITCLDPYDSEQQQQQRDLGLSKAALLICFGTAWSLYHVRETFAMMERQVERNLVREAQVRESNEARGNEMPRTT